MTDLDDRLETLAVAMQVASPEVDVDHALARVHRRNHQAVQRSRRRLAIGVGIAAAVLLAAVLVLPRRSGEVGTTDAPGSSSPSTAPPTTDDVERLYGQPPPVPDGEGPHLWISSLRVPTSGAELAVVVVDRTPSRFTFGVAAAVDRRTAAGWSPYGTASLCMDFWGCGGEITVGATTMAVPAIGVGGDPSRPMWLDTTGLEPGAYRLRSTGTRPDPGGGQPLVTVEAAAEFTVADDAPPLPPLDLATAIGPPSLAVDPVLTAPGLPRSIRATLQSRGEQTFEQLQTVWDRIGSQADVDWWTADGWHQVATATISGPTDRATDLSRSVALPALPVGAYRLVSRAPGAPEVLPAPFWVVDGGLVTSPPSTPR